jgi:hypothetical protein
MVVMDRSGWVAALVAGWSVGCGGKLPAEDQVTEGTSTSTSGRDTTTTSTATMEDESVATTTDSDTGDTPIPDDTPEPWGRCDMWTQDCPDGWKCAPRDSTGGGADYWNDNRCVPVVDDPAQPGEPCHVEGWPFSGQDDCDLGSFCWDLDPAKEGKCIAHCVGTPEDHACADEALVCMWTFAARVTLCLPPCDPLLQDCLDGEACHGADQGFACFPELEAPGGYGDACTHPIMCDAGMFCAHADYVPNCDVGPAVGCCSTLCNLMDDEPDAVCVAHSPDLLCVPWFAPGSAPRAYEHVGHCLSDA